MQSVCVLVSTMMQSKTSNLRPMGNDTIANVVLYRLINANIFRFYGPKLFVIKSDRYLNYYYLI